MMFYGPNHIARLAAVSLRSGVIFLRYFTVAARALAELESAEMKMPATLGCLYYPRRGGRLRW